jgi:hypothetical protein
MNPDNFDISADAPPTDGPSDPALEPITDDFDIFQGDVI